jgi:hypothetical protein
MLDSGDFKIGVEIHVASYLAYHRCSLPKATFKDQCRGQGVSVYAE